MLHFIDLSVYFAYLAILANYLLNPPLRADVTLSDPRGIMINLYSLSRLCRPWSSATLPLALVLLTFLVSFPSTPLPDSFSYTVLLMAFSWQIIVLHLPVHPSPLFLVPPDHSLPLAVLVWRGISRTFVPVVAFFVPGMLISLFLLSLSLSDIFPWLYADAVGHASPMETRVIFLSLFTVIFLFLACALGSSVLVHPFFAPTEGPAPLSWDRYSRSVGLEARQAFVRAVATYAAPYYFPAPLNLLQVLLVQLPRAIDALAGQKSYANAIGTVEKGLWRLMVAPFTFVLSAFWLWNLPRRW